jgi:hypothetical protein
MARIQFPAGTRDFSLLHNVQNGSGSHPTPLQWVPELFPPGAKRQGREVDHLFPSSAEVKNGEAVPPLPLRLHVVVLNELSTGQV